MPQRRSARDFDVSLNRLIADLGELRELLCEHDEGGWYRWIDASLGEITRFDTGGLDRLRRAYGGMGSFNDLVIGPRDGHTFTSAEITANKRLSRLRAECWRLATDLRLQLPP